MPIQNASNADCFTEIFLINKVARAAFFINFIIVFENRPKLLSQLTQNIQP